MAGYGISALGDGAGYVAVAWLATELAPSTQRPLAVGVALAAYLLPGALFALMAGTRIQGLDPRRLIALDALFRLCALAVIAGLSIGGRLALPIYVCLLAVSSLFHTFGSGGVVSLVGIHFASAHRFAANSLVQAVTQLSITVLGPAVGGVLVAALGAPGVLILDRSTPFSERRLA
jgi:DHA3 family macrolide efflux protein-like MFS transporter